MLKVRLLRSLVIFLFLAITTAVLVPHTLAEEAKQAEETTESFFERYTSYFYPNNKRDWYVSPLINLSFANPPVEGGLIFNHKNAFNRRYQAKLSTYFGINGYQNHYLRLYKKNPRFTEIDVTIDLGYKNTHKHFYGLGSDTVTAVEYPDDHDETVYRKIQGRCLLLVGYNLPASTKVDLGYQWKNTSIAEDYLYNMANLKRN